MMQAKSAGANFVPAYLQFGVSDQGEMNCDVLGRLQTIFSRYTNFKDTVRARTIADHSSEFQKSLLKSARTVFAPSVASDLSERAVQVLTTLQSVPTNADMWLKLIQLVRFASNRDADNENAKAVLKLIKANDIAQHLAAPADERGRCVIEPIDDQAFLSEFLHLLGAAELICAELVTKWPLKGRGAKYVQALLFSCCDIQVDDVKRVLTDEHEELLHEALDIAADAYRLEADTLGSSVGLHHYRFPFGHHDGQAPSVGFAARLALLCLGSRAKSDLYPIPLGASGADEGLRFTYSLTCPSEERERIWVGLDFIDQEDGSGLVFGLSRKTVTGEYERSDNWLRQAHRTISVEPNGAHLLEFPNVADRKAVRDLFDCAVHSKVFCRHAVVALTSKLGVFALGAARLPEGSNLGAYFAHGLYEPVCTANYRKPRTNLTAASDMTQTIRAIVQAVTSRPDSNSLLHQYADSIYYSDFNSKTKRDEDFPFPKGASPPRRQEIDSAAHVQNAALSRCHLWLFGEPFQRWVDQRLVKSGWSETANRYCRYVFLIPQHWPPSGVIGKTGLYRLKDHPPLAAMYQILTYVSASDADNFKSAIRDRIMKEGANSKFFPAGVIA